MGREKDRKLRRKRRRLTKLRKLKVRLAQSKNLKDRQLLTQKIIRTSIHPPTDIDIK